MKGILFFSLFLLSFVLGYAQAVSINTDGSAADGSAILDLKSDNKGFLPPRMTTLQRDAIVAPAEGLQIYNMDKKKPQFFNGICWVSFSGSLDIGDNHEGGIIFYLDATGCHGLVCTNADQNTDAKWGCFATDTPAPNVTSFPPSGPGAEIGNGVTNTSSIIAANCAGSNDAAVICDGLNLNGYTDWFLPSSGELNLMYTNLHLAGFGGFARDYYWSSTEHDNIIARLQNFNDGVQDFFSKSNLFRVRAVRAF